MNENSEYFSYLDWNRTHINFPSTKIKYKLLYPTTMS